MLPHLNKIEIDGQGFVRNENIKIRPVGVALFHKNGRTDRRRDTNRRLSHLFCECV